MMIHENEHQTAVNMQDYEMLNLKERYNFSGRWPHIILSTTYKIVFGQLHQHKLNYR